jgi:hypothetical protein
MDLVPGNNVEFGVPPLAHFGQWLCLLRIKTVLLHSIEIDEASPSEDEAAALAALRRPDSQGLAFIIQLIVEC